ncbi:MAG: hypothetical protein U1E17_23975 [Geminicoccaceae bacterium]
MSEAPGSEAPATEAPGTEIVGVFDDRDRLEAAIEMLQSHGLERSQLTVLGTADAVRGRLGLEVAPPAEPGSQFETPVDRSEQQNMTPLLTGVPAYIGAAVAAGVTVASGGTLAGAAVAALLGATGGGLLGASAAGAMRDSVTGSYEEQLAHGGILLLVHPRRPEDIAHAREVLERYARRIVATEPDRPLT